MIRFPSNEDEVECGQCILVLYDIGVFFVVHSTLLFLLTTTAPSALMGIKAFVPPFNSTNSLITTCQFIENVLDLHFCFFFLIKQRMKALLLIP